MGRMFPCSLLRIWQSSVRGEESDRLAQAMGLEAWEICPEPLGEAQQWGEGVHRTGARCWGPCTDAPREGESGG